MRIRPFFWFLLALFCSCVLLFASTFQIHAPVHLQVHVQSSSLETSTLTKLELHLTDPQGLPIEKANILSEAHMPTMWMPQQKSQIRALGHGRYLLQLRLTMAGSWEVTIHAWADGFDSLQHTVQLRVV